MKRPFVIDQKNAKMMARLGASTGEFQNFLNMLGASEYCLIALMQQQNVWKAPQPPAEPAAYAGLGSLDLGTALFLINNPTYVETGSGVADLVATLNTLVAFYNYWYSTNLAIPASVLPASQYDLLATPDLIAPDGSVACTATYNMYDQYWVGALDNLLRSVFYDYYAPFNIPATASPASSFETDGQVTLGLLSDWGTGTTISASTTVMTKLAGQNPDCVIHLGDVYYSGTPTSEPPDTSWIDPSADFGPLEEEQNNLITPWNGPSSQSFTLNSNHEMYSGGYGLFGNALATGGTFATQSGYSMFWVKIGDWAILALDSAYNSDPFQLYMYGDLNGGTTTGPQTTWIGTLGLDSSKTIVLTHHNGFDFACSPSAQSNYAPFWAQVNQALGGDPYAWYWGHIHYGVAYDSPVSIAASGNSQEFTTNTYCRCLGHGALPFGLTTELTMSSPTNGQTQVEWFATDGDGQSLLYNGFVTLVFTVANNVVTGITENFFDIGSTTARLSRALYPPPSS